MAGDRAVRLSIDGREIEVTAGTLVVEAAKRLNIEIPVFCYHPKLDPVGMCRLCLVEVGIPRRGSDGQLERDAQGKPVIAMLPKPQTACTLPVAEGMAVRSNSEAVADARRAVIEFLLTSHPLDCPVCDKGGECPLQELTFAYGPGKSRFDDADKFHFEKPIPLSPLVFLDRERCILCARCTRFQEEIAWHPVLGLSNRGRGMEVVTFSDPPFNSKFSGNTIDICPVGALTSVDFRFKARVWELVDTPSVCGHCPVGCNITVGSRVGEIKRIVPRENEAVNEVWICDKGRFAHHYIRSPKRITTPLIRRDGQLREATWEEALKFASSELVRIQKQSGPQALAGIGSLRTTNEENYLFQKFVRVVLGTNNLDHRLDGGWGAAERWSIPTASLRALEEAHAILIVGCDPSEEVPVLELRIKKAMRRHAAKLIVLSPRPIELCVRAAQWLQHPPGLERAVLAGILKRLLERSSSDEKSRRSIEGSLPTTATELGVSEDELDGAAATLAQAHRVALLYGEAAVDEGYLPALIDLATLKGLGPQGASLYPIRRGGNAQGALDMGVHPRWLPGYQPIEDPIVRERMEKLWGAKLPSESGRDTRQILSGAAAGEIKGLYILGADPLAHYPDRALVEEALRKVELLIVQELFLTETATRAQVVLPAAAFAEKEGTFTNLERRVQRIWPATPPRGQAKTDAEILSALAAAMGHRFEHPTAEAIWEEVRRAAPVYAGMTYARLGEVGMQWPCPAPDHPGSEHLPADWLPDEWVPLPEPELTALREGEFHLVVGPWLFDGGNMVSRTQLLRYLVPEPRLHLHPQDAQRLGIREGQRVRIWADGRALELPAHIAHTIQPGAVFAYGNLPGAALNRLGTRRVYIEVGAG